MKRFDNLWKNHQSRWWKSINTIFSIIEILPFFMWFKYLGLVKATTGTLNNPHHITYTESVKIQPTFYDTGYLYRKQMTYIPKINWFYYFCDKNIPISWPYFIKFILSFVNCKTNKGLDSNDMELL